MPFERQPTGLLDTGSEETTKGAEACNRFKEKKPDVLHWGQIDCLRLTPDEAHVIAKFDDLKKHPSMEDLLALNTEVLDLHKDTGGSSVTEALLNELAVLRYDIKPHHKKDNADGH